MIEVLYLSNAGGGTSERKIAKNGCTLGEFLAQVGCDLGGGGQTITVNRDPAPLDQVLKDGQTVAVTPTEVRGSVLVS